MPGLTRFLIDPVGAVRISRRDYFKPSPAASRYFVFKDQLRIMARGEGWEVPADGLSLRFVIAMPRSWSAKRRAEMVDQPHQSKPDLDNLVKAVKDALCKDDAHVWRYGRMEKVWGETGAIEVLG